MESSCGYCFHTPRLTICSISHCTCFQDDQERKQKQKEMENYEQQFGLVKLPRSTNENHVDVGELKAVLHEAEFYQQIEINEYLPTDRIQRHHWLKKLKEHGLPWYCYLYSQTHTGMIENLHFLWKTDEEVDPECQAKVLSVIQQRLPVYHSKSVKKKFREAANKLSISAMHSRYLYKLATSDASAPENEAIAAIDQRVMDYIRYEDEDVVMDLRQLHTSGPSHFQTFFELAQVEIENSVGTAVDDRRHGAVVHLAAALSASDLHRCDKHKYFLIFLALNN